MATEEKNVFVKLTAAIAIGGAIHKAGTTVEVTEANAKNLLNRGKALIATEADNPVEAPVADEVSEAPAGKKKKAPASE